MDNRDNINHCVLVKQNPRLYLSNVGGACNIISSELCGELYVCECAIV